MYPSPLFTIVKPTIKFHVGSLLGLGYCEDLKLIIKTLMNFHILMSSDKPWKIRTIKH